jgi:hypothetical protein
MTQNPKTPKPLRYPDAK